MIKQESPIKKFHANGPKLPQKSFFRETKRSWRVYLVMMFWCFKDFQMPPPKKYDNKILHVGPVDVFWHFRQNFPNFGEKSVPKWCYQN